MGTTAAGMLLAVMAVSLHIASCHRSLVKGSSPLSFTHHLYNATIYENSAPRTYVESGIKMGIVVTDDFWDIKYKLVAGDEDSLFKTEEVTVGDFCFLRIKTRSSNSALLNREVRDSYTLTIEASESTYDYQARTKVLIQVLDTNDLKPLFYPASYNVNIKEDTALKTSVVQVSATDADISSNADFYYTFMSRSHPFAVDPFTVDPFTGVISTSEEMDYELMQRWYHLRVRASDSGSPFSHDFSVGESIGVMSAVDLDELQQVRYSIESGNERALFNIDPVSGSIRLAKKIPLSLSAEVEVLDVNENLNTPAFSSFVYKVAVMEDAKVGTSVVTLTAVDRDLGKDGVVRYHIHGGTGLGVFTIDEETGVIRTAETLDREAIPHYWITVYATDLGTVPLVSWTEVFVEVMDINDNPPELSKPIYFGSVLENSPKGKSVLKVAATDVDLDSEEKLTFQIVDSQRLFSINTKTGVITTQAVLDREQKAEHIIEVIVSDNGAPALRSTGTVVIHVQDENDNSPQFNHKLFQVKLPERQGVAEPQEVYRMVVRDDDEGPNAEVTFSLETDLEHKFDIHPTTGVVSSMGDFGHGNYTILTVKATDHGSPARRSTARLDIEWIPKPTPSSEPLAFDEPHFNFAVMEMDPVNHMVGIISTDRIGSLLWFDIIGGDDELDFDMEKDTGTIMIARRLDAGKRSNYNLTVRVTDGSQIITTQAYIRVVDMNGYRPVFLKSQYEVVVPEDTAPWKEILQISAQDRDINSRLLYTIHSGIHPESVSHFQLDPNSGILVIKEKLDFETLPVHTLVLMVRDQEIPMKKNFVKAVVHVEDCNDHSPVFMSSHYEANVLNLEAIGTEVLQTRALDKDTGSNSEIIYSFHSGNTDGAFSIDPQTGHIKVAKPLDTLPHQQYHLTVKATDQGFPQRSDLSPVNIHVKLSDKTPPKFSSDEYFTEISESTPQGSPFFTVTASSPSAVHYKIKGGDPNGTFHINYFSGVLSIQRALNFEECFSYQLQVRASSLAGSYSDAVVYIYVIDENDNAPVFLQEEFVGQISESAHINTMVMGQNNTPLVILATDADKDANALLVFQILEPEGEKFFKIDPSMGTLSLIAPIDFELTPEIHFSVQFKASEYQVSIQSSVNKGSPVIQIMAYDADDGKNADVTYTVDEAEEVMEEVIEINPFTGVVSTKESLVGMENKIFNFKIKARDGGTPFYNSTVPVQVKVVSPELPLPRFSEPLYTFSAVEDLPLGSEIGVVKADADTPIIYSLVDGNTVESNKEQVFGVDKDSGALFVQKGIDYEKTKWYQIDVMANCNRNGTDVASLVSVSIQVQDVNDNQPVFEANPYQAFLAENMPPGTTVIQVTANDPDLETNGEVTYRVEPDPDDVSEVFTIDSESGWITTLKETDCETNRLYRFHVVATDHGGKVKLSSSVLVEVFVTDENDNSPQFTEEVYQGSVIENSRPGEAIVTVSVTDADVSKENRQFTCYITDGDPQDQFSIVQVGEEWKVTLKSSLDREAKERYGLKIIATDGRFQASATVDVHVLDINDNSPLCEQLLYTEVIMENSPPGIFILKVSATDPDIGTNGQVSFTLHGPNADKFHLDPQTGELFTLSVVDREREIEYDLVAKATDGGGRSCQADVLLMIQDMNDNPPRFPTNHYDVTVFDNTTVRTPIAVIYAKDPDTGINSEVVYSLLGSDSSYFSLDEFSGILRLERSLSDEPQSKFELKVQATDRGLPHRRSSIATVTVSVVDLKDYQPVFLSNEYTAQIPESIAVGTEILSVSALAKDATDNVPITYDIVSGNEHGKFEIDSETGALLVNGSLDFEHCREYYLSVEGARGKSSLSDIAMVIINITDINDNTPAFGLGDYSKEISEDISPGDTVMQVSADDLDGPLNNIIHYSIASGDPERQFGIDPRSGEIRVIRRLDREEVTHYSLTVQAADSGHPPLSTAVQVTVTVSDVNDNPPVFSKINHSVVLQEGEPMGSSILQLSVTDRDTPRNGPPFSFHILSGNEDKRFHIDQGGLLSVGGPLRKRTKAQHLLKIQVTDSGHPPLSSICVVRINITEQSRYPPSVVPLDVFITTTDRAFSSRLIGKLHATDQDLHDVLSYKLDQDSPDSGRFSVGAADGKIVAESPLEPGLYFLNVSVSDGKFSAWAGVRVHVWTATQQALDRGVTLQLAGLTPEEFVSDHWRAVQRSLGAGLHVASLQQEPGSSSLEVLLVWRTAEPPPANQLARVMEDDIGVNVLRVRQGSCVGLDCPPRGCRNTVHMTGERAFHYTSARTGFITPRHTWESVCFCNESAVRFDGNGYLKFLYQADAAKQVEQNFQLSLNIKTFQEQGLVMSTNSTDWGALEVDGGELRFRYGCGNALPGALRVRAGPVSDGRRHHVLLEVRGVELTLTLDRTHSDSVTLSEPCRMTRPGGALAFAAPWSPPHGGGRTEGFRGCLDEVAFNGEAVRAAEGGQRPQSQLGDRRVFGRYQCCSQTEGCASHPCQNGGTCEEISNGEFRCSCTLQYFGSRCEQANNPCSSQPCAHGGTCQPKAQGYICSCPDHATGNRCQESINACSSNPCPSGYDCKMNEKGLMHCDPLPQVSGGIGVVEIVEIAASALGILFLVGVFVCIRKRYVQRKKQKPATARDSNGYYPPSLAKSMMGDGQQTPPIEMNMLADSRNDLDHDPFRTLKPRGQTELVSRGGNQAQKAQGPVVCSVAPNLPPPPPSSSDNESILKNNWELDYDVYPADPDYYGRPTVQEFPQFDIVEGTFPAVPTMDPRRTSRFGGFPFPLDRCDRRAPLPPCYSNQNLDDFLGPDGQPLPTSQCPNEYTAISYYPTERTHSVDNVSGGNYRRLSMRLSVAQPSYADCSPPPQGALGLPVQEPHSYAGSDMVESDYGSCEEVMF
ncbi:hypothetical protein COCON_G00046550 [Conger conger]|uniref:Uncharacterized protein n=1 Tax=Conger conger TaxID=82655 RepID=A0A9Q1I544_CONCO|nr:hypothetical protein COCON_G00046550 [Conger conger]